MISNLSANVLIQRLKFILTLRCDRASRLMSDAQDRQLRWFEWLALKGHLLACRVCPAVGKQFRLISRASHEKQPTMSASGKSSLKARLKTMREEGND